MGKGHMDKDREVGSRGLGGVKMETSVFEQQLEKRKKIFKIKKK